MSSRTSSPPSQTSTATIESTDELWNAVLAEAEVEVSRPNFHTWFKKTSLAAIEEKVAHVVVPNNFVKEWLEAKYKRFILKTLRSYNREICDITFSITKPEAALSSRTQETSAAPANQKQTKDDNSSKEQSLPLEPTPYKESGLRPRYSFSSFVVGPSNELAHSAAAAVTKQPGTLYNPLFLYGGVGLGKTHLLQAVGNHLVRTHKDKKLAVRYISSERFIRDFVSAIRTRTTERFKATYRRVDVLIIDDIQFIAGKDSSQEELFHTFNELSSKEAQIVFSSDRPPHEIPSLEDRLRSRFEGGMIADIQPPDFETRVAILHTKAKEKGASLPDDIMHSIAEVVEQNIRELEGALNRILSHNILKKKDQCTPKKVQEILRASFAPPPRLNLKEIITTVSEFYDIGEDDLFKKSRRQDIVHPRQVAMYLARELLEMSYPSIGKRFNGLDHTTVMHAHDRISKELSVSGPVADEISGIKSMLRNLRG